ncbi:MAG: hypothetical protein AAGG72_03700 [Pseudomonadota bacterium]
MVETKPHIQARASSLVPAIFAAFLGVNLGLCGVASADDSQRAAPDRPSAERSAPGFDNRRIERGGEPQSQRPDRSERRYNQRPNEGGGCQYQGRELEMIV